MGNAPVHLSSKSIRFLNASDKDIQGDTIRQGQNVLEFQWGT